MPAQKRPRESITPPPPPPPPDPEKCDDPLQGSDNHNDGERDSACDSDGSSYSSVGEKDEFIVVKLADVRKEVQCAICLGVIRKTRTVMECLHRFCRECIDKSLRLGNNECPVCRTHCASRLSLRDDPNYDALIAALYSNMVPYRLSLKTMCASDKQIYGPDDEDLRSALDWGRRAEKADSKLSELKKGAAGSKRKTVKGIVIKETFEPLQKKKKVVAKDPPAGKGKGKMPVSDPVPLSDPIPTSDPIPEPASDPDPVPVAVSDDDEDDDVPLSRRFKSAESGGRSAADTSNPIHALPLTIVPQIIQEQVRKSQSSVEENPTPPEKDADFEASKSVYSPEHDDHPMDQLEGTSALAEPATEERIDEIPSTSHQAEETSPSPKLSPTEHFIRRGLVLMLDTKYPDLIQKPEIREDILQILAWRDMRTKRFEEFGLIIEKKGGIRPFLAYEQQIRKSANVMNPFDLLSDKAVEKLICRKLGLPEPTSPSKDPQPSEERIVAEPPQIPSALPDLNSFQDSVAKTVANAVKSLLKEDLRDSLNAYVREAMVAAIRNERENLAARCVSLNAEFAEGVQQKILEVDTKLSLNSISRTEAFTKMMNEKMAEFQNLIDQLKTLVADQSKAVEKQHIFYAKLEKIATDVSFKLKEEVAKLEPALSKTIPDLSDFKDSLTSKIDSLFAELKDLLMQPKRGKSWLRNMQQIDLFTPTDLARKSVGSLFTPPL